MNAQSFLAIRGKGSRLVYRDKTKMSVSGVGKILGLRGFVGVLF